jgi:seryl-tRNA synthetase
MSMLAPRRSVVAWISRATRSVSTARLFSTPTTAATATTATINDRLSRKDLSLDLRTVSTHLDVVLSHVRARHGSDATVEAAQEIADLFAKRVALIRERDDHLNKRKEASALVGKLMRQQTTNVQDQVEAAKATSADAAERAAAAESELDELQSKMDLLLAGIPNLLDDITPNGKDESENLEVYKWGDVHALPRKFGWPDNFQPLWHDDVAVNLGGYLADQAVKISGARFFALSGPVARLERALSSFMLDTHTANGYTEVTVPYVVSRSTLEGTSQLPKFQDDLFAISPESHTCNGEDAFLIPTAEVPVTSLHRDEILEAGDLPKKYVSLTPCFRAEAGSYGRDTKGLIRTHQFHKVELVKVTSAETSDEEHEELTKDSEKILQALVLPYRKVRLCSGDIGFAARHCYDLEVFLPGANEYREISSCSNCGDFQSRRMSMRYRLPDKKKKPQLCHTINGSGLAVGRTLVAVLENYQQEDGSVVIPEVLRPYMGGLEVLEPVK